MRQAWLALALAALSGCGYVGDVQPPALNIPMPVTDLAGVQRGAKLVLSFTPPSMTTERLPIAQPGEVEVRVGPPGEGAFDVNNWASAATKVEASTANTAEADVAAFAGKEIFAAVRTAGPKGRWSGWSNVVAVTIAPPLEKPADFKAEADPGGVRLSWRDKAPEGTHYRIYRQAPEEQRLSMLEPKGTNPYIDGTAEYGKPYKYQVQAAIEAGSKEAESERSDIAEVTPIDTFAPAVPAGLNALAGLSSIELAWDRNTEADFRGYHVYRAVGQGAFERIGELTEAPAFSDKAIQAGTAYRYAVTSVDQKGNESAKSEPVAIIAPQ